VGVTFVERLKIVGIGGSLARVSSSLAALRIAVEGAAEGDADARVLDIRALALPRFDPDLTEIPASVAAFCDTVYAAHGLVWSSPLYNGTISGSFKNALDWLHLLGDRTPAFLTDKIVPTKSWAWSARPAECTGCRRSTRWSLSSERCAAGPCRWSYPFPRPRAPSMTRAGLAILSSRRSCDSSAAKSRARRDRWQHTVCATTPTHRPL
jgi:hypothetical protein